ncbi:hypothetical protein KM043_005291 [Ampulex compressa]|nr:hypothetical protein KM043_005291 [Ampulex compressa]
MTDRISVDPNNVDPFSETPLEYAPCEGNGEIIVEQSTKGSTESVVNESTYAEPLTPEQIRWFYKGGVDKRWVEFCGYDSLRIETAWRNYENLLDKKVDGPNNLPVAEKVVVRGGMYDVELDNMKCVPIYWPGEKLEIMRGTWYYDGSWIPLELEHSKVIEKVHLSLFQKQSVPQSSSTCESSIPSHSYKVLRTKHFPEFHVDWHTMSDVALYSEYTPTKLMRSVTSKLGFAKTTGYRLRRGYRIAAVPEDKPHDIDHLVFVVHGIGHKRDTEKIIRNTTSFRDCVDWLKRKYFPKSNHRVEFFPVEWRSSLKLDGDIVEAITPSSVLSIRDLLNTSAMDILYYTSPLYGGEVRAGLQTELNRLYFMFASRHPGWKGKVSILAHSLGCVIVYDIVTGWMGPDTRPPSPASQEVLLQGLQFPIENLFCLGSPLSVFLALRTRAPSNSLDVMPQGLCKRFYNIFHWSDPVAYRMEPLLERGYSKIEPVLIPPYGGGEGQQMEQSPPSMSNVDQNLPTTDNDERDDVPVDAPHQNVDKGWSLWGLVRSGWNVKEGPSSPTPDSNPPIRPGQELTQRLDYVLRAVGLGRNYLYAVTAHTSPLRTMQPVQINLLAAVIGAAVGILTVAGVMFYENALRNKEHVLINSDLDAVNKRIAILQKELEALRVQQSKQRKRRKDISRKNASNDSTNTVTDIDTDVDACSTAGTDIADDEFFDCSDSEGGAGDADIRIPEATNHLDLDFDAIDKFSEEEYGEKEYLKLQSLLNQYPDNVNVIWRFARSCYNYTVFLSDAELKQKLLCEGIKACEPVLSVQNAELHKWYAILIGLNGDYLPVADRIKNGYNFNQHIKIALELKPDDAHIYYLLGRFQYEVSSLSWLEKKIAAALYSELPNASYEEAIKNFEEAEKLMREPRIDNRLYLSKSYIAVNEYQKALDLLDKTLEMPAMNLADEEFHREVKALLKKYSHYRL